MVLECTDNPVMVVAVPTIRPRILKVHNGHIEGGRNLGCSAHDPTEDTGKDQFLDVGGVHPTRCSAHDPTEDTERRKPLGVSCQGLVVEVGRQCGLLPQAGWFWGAGEWAVGDER